MFKTLTRLDRRRHFKMNVYYLRRFFGVKEAVLVALLIVGGLVLFFTFRQWLILLLAGITVVIMAGAMAVFLAISKKSFDEEYVKRHTEEIAMEFGDDSFSTEIREERGERSYTEKRGYDAVEKIALLSDRIYLYLGAGLAYYILYTDMTQGDFASLCEFLRSKVAPQAFKMKDSRRRNKQFPYGR